MCQDIQLELVKGRCVAFRSTLTTLDKEINILKIDVFLTSNEDRLIGTLSSEAESSTIVVFRTKIDVKSLHRTYR